MTQLWLRKYSTWRQEVVNKTREVLWKQKTVSFNYLFIFEQFIFAAVILFAPKHLQYVWSWRIIVTCNLLMPREFCATCCAALRPVQDSPPPGLLHLFSYITRFRAGVCKVRSFITWLFSTLLWWTVGPLAYSLIILQLTYIYSLSLNWSLDLSRYK